MLAIVICCLLGLSAGQDLLYQGIAEKGSALVKASQTINAYIGDKDCDASIAFPTVLPCRPGVLRVAVKDSAPYPDVTIDETLMQAIVRRQPPCNLRASVDIEYECVLTDDQSKVGSKEAEAEDYSSEEFNFRADEPVRLEPLKHLNRRRHYD